MTNITVTTAATFIPEVWSKDVLFAKEEKLVMANLVDKHWTAEMVKLGDILHIPFVKNLSVTDKTANTEVTFSANTEGEITITVNKHKHVAVRIEDIVAKQAKPELRAGYTRKMGFALAKQVDTDLAGLYTALSITKGFTTSKLTYNIILDANQVLDENDVPSDDRHLFISAAQKRAMLEIPEFINKDFSILGNLQLNGAMKGAFMGSILENIGVWWSNNVPTTGTAPKVSHNMLFHREAFALVMQQDIRMQSDYNIRHLADELVGDALYGVQEIRDDATNLGVYAVHIQAQDAA
jgi:hypothetical protein